MENKQMLAQSCLSMRGNTVRTSSQWLAVSAFSVILVMQQVQAEEIDPSKWNQVYPTPELQAAQTAQAFAYHPDLYNTPLSDGAGISGFTSVGSIYRPADWEYYRFCAQPGDNVSIEVHRTTYEMDPAMMICHGTTSDSAGIAANNCGANMSFVGFADDSVGIPHGVGGNFADPKVDFKAPPGPVPNEFTLMVFDFLGAGSNPQYEIHASGLSRCSIPVVIDIKPESDLNSINMCSSGAVPIAIFGADDLDVYEIDPESLRLAEAAVKVVGRKDPQSLCSFDDVNYDGYDDLVCHFVTSDLGSVDGESTSVMVTGKLYDGTSISGSDRVSIVKDDCI